MHFFVVQKLFLSTVEVVFHDEESQYRMCDKQELQVREMLVFEIIVSSLSILFQVYTNHEKQKRDGRLWHVPWRFYKKI